MFLNNSAVCSHYINNNYYNLNNLINIKVIIIIKKKIKNLINSVIIYLLGMAYIYIMYTYVYLLFINICYCIIHSQDCRYIDFINGQKPIDRPPKMLLREIRK